MCNTINGKNPFPKRRKAKDNPYTIFTVGDKSDLHYYLSFVDNRGVSICMEISEQLFTAFDQFEREDLSALNEVDRHYEHAFLSDESLWRRSLKDVESPEDRVERKMQIHRALETLTPAQRRRVCMYHFYGFTYEEIAAVEGCSAHSVAKSIKLAEKKLRIILSD